MHAPCEQTRRSQILGAPRATSERSFAGTDVVTSPRVLAAGRAPWDRRAHRCKEPARFWCSSSGDDHTLPGTHHPWTCPCCQTQIPNRGLRARAGTADPGHFTKRGKKRPRERGNPGDWRARRSQASSALSGRSVGRCRSKNNRHRSLRSRVKATPVPLSVSQRGSAAGPGSTPLRIRLPWQQRQVQGWWVPASTPGRATTVVLASRLTALSSLNHLGGGGRRNWRESGGTETTMKPHDFTDFPPTVTG